MEAQRSGRGGRRGRQFAEVAHKPTVSRALMVTSSHPANSRSCFAPWLVDSGASQHMSPNRSDFLTLEPLPVPIKVYLGDEAWIPAVAQGKVQLVLEPGLRHIEIVALFVPSLGSSLLSVGQLSTEFEV